ncbi:MAG: hypothetical protein KatS3mg115_0732 [Candidatus Poribacteria bacterium]|nr:MAG: hypothetical protein KatS3mg115_0732 [Candidatus Poribacteria bacterium]
MPYRIWDPLFADLYLHRDQIELTVENRTDGVRIVVRRDDRRRREAGPGVRKSALRLPGERTGRDG